MIKIIAKRLVREECLEDYIRLTEELVAASQAEPGCVTYTLNRCTENPRLFSFIEIWKDQAAIDAHNASEHFTRIVPQLGKLLEINYPVEHYTEVWG
ncbi:MAG: antibiotic biosynthesis monooxygenase [Oscillospiraceae bacterium]|nr:antibiotic biosynthesis monooxygenase [Oscillospiraceae bacterium]